MTVETLLPGGVPAPVEPEPAAITWHSFDLRTGRRGPQLVTQQMGTIGRIIGEPTDAQQTVLCWDEEEQQPLTGREPATLPGRTMLVALNQDEEPVWGGMVLRRRSNAGVWVGLDLATLEAYFDRRYVKDHTYTSTPQGAIIEGILAADVIPTGIEFTVDAASTQPRDREYLDDEDKTVLSVLQELMAVEDGPEFTVDLEWADDTRTVLDRVVRVRDRIGTAAAVPVQLVMPGPVVDFDYVEDFTTDNGANDVMATSSGEGDTRPESVHQVAQDLLDNGWPRYERRFEPSTSITSIATLNAHAAADLAETRDGLAELTLTVHLDSGPRVGVDFHLGDNLTAVLTCPRFPELTGPDGDKVPGYTRTVRCIGYEIDYDSRRLMPRTVEVE